MDSAIVQPVKRRPYWSFIALVYAILGWALFEAWLIFMGAGFLLHIFAAIPGFTLTIRSALRPPIDRQSELEAKNCPVTQFHLAKTSCVLLYFFGAILGFMLLNGSITLLGAVIASFAFAPWARLPFSRNHLAISCLIAISGFASVISIGHRYVDMMFFPFAAWSFWGFACCALLFRAEQLQRSKYENNTTKDKVTTPTSPAHSSG